MRRLYCCARYLASSSRRPRSPRTGGVAAVPRSRRRRRGGRCDAARPVVRDGPTRECRWAAEIPGRGWSSRIVLGDRLFVTSAIRPGAFKAPSKGSSATTTPPSSKSRASRKHEIVKSWSGEISSSRARRTKISYIVAALDANTGTVVWLREADQAQPPGGSHRKNTYASETPATDGERLYASFGGNIGVFRDHSTAPSVAAHPAAEPIYPDFGTASSPVVHNGRVYQLHDNDGQSFLAALDAKTGKESLERQSQPTSASRLASGWATPLVWESGSRTEIVTIGRGFVISYDTDGSELWRLKGMTQATPSPVVADNLLYVGSGSQGEANRPIYAVRPNAKGDISLREDQRPMSSSPGRSRGSPATLRRRSVPRPHLRRQRQWRAASGGRKDRRRIYKARVGGGGFTFSSSPIASRGRIYLLSEDGDAFVLNAATATTRPRAAVSER